MMIDRIRYRDEAGKVHSTRGMLLTVEKQGTGARVWRVAVIKLRRNILHIPEGRLISKGILETV